MEFLSFFIKTVFALFPQTKFRLNLRQPDVGHNAGASQAESAQDAECSAPRQRGPLPRLTHSLRHSVLHSRRHRVARLPAPRDDPLAAHPLRLGSVLLPGVSTRASTRATADTQFSLSSAAATPALTYRARGVTTTCITATRRTTRRHRRTPRRPATVRPIRRCATAC